MNEFETLRREIICERLDEENWKILKNLKGDLIMERRLSKFFARDGCRECKCWDECLKHIEEGGGLIFDENKNCEMTESDERKLIRI